MITRRADFAPASADASALTCDLIWSTGADVARRDKVGPYLERLSMTPEAVDLSRLIGAPLLNSHMQRDLGDVLGVVTDASVDGKQGVATVRFSQRAQSIFDDVAAGIVRQVSCGYHVSEWTASNEAGQRVRIATRWQPLELSLVPIAADPAATTRSHPPMETTTTTEAGDTRAAGELEIRSIASKYALDADEIINLGGTAADARRMALAELVKRAGPETRPAVTMGVDHDDPSERAAAYGEALHCRIDPSRKPSERAAQYVHMSLADMARDTLRHRGHKVGAMSADALVTRALHTTSDFSLVLADTVGRELRAAYQVPPSGVRELARTTSVKDFRAKTLLQFGDHLALETVNEHGEFRSGTLTEAGESVRVTTYGKIFGYTRQLMVNDDLGALARIGAVASQSARQLEADLLVDLLTTGSGLGPVMADGQRMFHSTHGNVSGSGATVANGIAAAVLAMRKQTGLSGKIIDVRPTVILVPAALEYAVSQLFMAPFVATKATDANPYSYIRVIVDPRLDAKSATRWYLVSENFEGLLAAYLEGSTGPQIDTKAGFEIDGVSIRVRLDFGAAVIDHRSWYSNAGA